MLPDQEKSASMLSQDRLGFVSVHRSLDRTVTHAVSYNVVDDRLRESASVLNDSNRFHLLKAIDFDQKLIVLQHTVEEENGTERGENHKIGTLLEKAPFQTILLAILSDIAVEINCYHSVEKLDLSSLDTQLATLVRIAEFKYKNKGTRAVAPSRILKMAFITSSLALARE